MMGEMKWHEKQFDRFTNVKYSTREKGKTQAFRITDSIYTVCGCWWNTDTNRTKHCTRHGAVIISVGQWAP